jgi:Protein of unknown function (DUF3800)
VVCASQSREFTIEDLFDLVFPMEMGVTGYLCMICHCFLDDSKDQKQDQMVVSAGFIGTQDARGSLRRAWKKRLTDDGIEYFKTNEYKMLDGQFLKFKDEVNYPKPKGRDAARKIKADLQEIVKVNHPIVGVGIAIPISDYSLVCDRPEAQGVFYGDPYHRALESVMFEVAKMVRGRPGRNMVAFVHDEGPDYDSLRHVYRSFLENNPKSAKVIGGFQRLDDKLHPPLQAADMIANNILGLGIDWLSKGRPDPLKVEMKESIQKVGIWTEHYMLSILKSQLRVHGRPIPIDIEGEEYG